MDSKPEPVNSVLSTPEVREMIMKNLDILSLVNCRLVSKSWNATASSLLKKRPVWIRREWNAEKFEQLYKCVKRSTNFPFCRLDLSITAKGAGELDFKNGAKLFMKFGTTFTHLRAKSSTKWRKGMLRDLLQKTAKLQYLELGKLPYYAKGEKPELSSLRTLKFASLYDERRGERVLEQLIRSAPLLEEIRHVRCDSTVQMTAVRNAKKFHLVSSMIITDFIKTSVCSELIASPPQLTALTVEANYGVIPCRYFLVALKSLLTHNASTLKKLNISNFTEQLDELPVFHKLEELSFNINPRRLHAPVSAVIPHLSSSSFPKLKTIQLNTEDAEITERLISNNFWEAFEPLESVDKLELDSYCGPAVIKYLASCFPQVSYIAVNYKLCKYGKEKRQDSNIWLLQDFANLRKLDILGYPFKYGIMDSFLTGIPTEIMAKLRAAPKEALTPWMSEILRSRGNILQLTNLKELTVTIETPPYNISGKNPFMTMVSIWYALELIPGLRANFLCCCRSFTGIFDHSEDFPKAFQLVKDYVTVGPCFCDED